MVALKIMLVDNHRVMREGLRILIDSEKDMKVVAEADNGREALSISKKHRPDIILMDVMMPDMNGIEAARRIRSEFETIRILALSMYDDRHYVAEMLRAGASGYLLKDCAFKELSGAIRTVAEGKFYLSPSISGMVIEEYIKMLENDDGEETISTLTSREREILQLIAEGRSTREIANAINVSMKTVETHRYHIMQKVNVNSIAELTKFAIREGLTSLCE